MKNQLIIFAFLQLVVILKDGNMSDRGYKQYTKNFVRHSVIKYAVSMLTTQRQNATCVHRDYVREVYDYFTKTEDESRNKLEALRIHHRSYFIESILLGTEIPPLVFFQSQSKIEVIDGRQRYETIERFLNDKFVLNESGLHCLKSLAGKKYSQLDSEIKELFEETRIRILQFHVVNEPKLEEESSLTSDAHTY